ncbi:MAG: hypothetical protein ACHQ4G_13690 [Opitutales bacterium]
MRRTALFLTAAALVACAANLSAQGTNFSGTWTRDTTGMGAMMGGGGGGGGGRMGGGGAAPMTITQDAKTLTIARTMGGMEMKTVYNLDGSDSKNTGMGRGGNPGTEQISNATWAGATLSIATKRTMQDGSTSVVTAVYSLDATGKVLSVATTAPGRNGGDPTTTTAKYNKN